MRGVKAMNVVLRQGCRKQNLPSPSKIDNLALYGPSSKTRRFEKSQGNKAGLLEQQLGTPRSRLLQALALALP